MRACRICLSAIYTNPYHAMIFHPDITNKPLFSKVFQYGFLIKYSDRINTNN